MRFSNLPLFVVLVFGGACAGQAGKTQSAGGKNTDIVIGRYCAADADCGAGYRCFDEHTGSAWVPDGYCLLAGSACWNDGECPKGTLCSPLPWCQIPGVCLLACRDGSDCRKGYVCDTVELFPGQKDSPATSGKVCWSSGSGGQSSLEIVTDARGLKTHVGQQVMVEGKVADAIGQHLVSPPETHPQSTYFDIGGYQVVVYSKEPIECAGRLAVAGTVVEIKGKSKAPDSSEVYTEYHILVDAWQCAK